MSSKITNTNIKPTGIWYNPDCMWTSVPKNANMMYRQMCTEMNMVHCQYQNHVAKESVCVLRNPYTRIVSGIGEYTKRHSTKFNGVPFESMLYRLLNTPQKFDEHLEPQSFYISGKKYTHVLKFEDLYNETLRVKYFAKHRNLVDKFVEMRRTRRSRYFRESPEELIQKHQDLFDQIVEKYYQKDLELWKNHRSFENVRIKNTQHKRKT